MELLTPDELRALVGVMRELGVTAACGVVLGPEPPKLADLERAAKQETDPAARRVLEAEVAAERHREAVAAWHEETRELLAANGETYTDEQCERMRPFQG